MYTIKNEYGVVSVDDSFVVQIISDARDLFRDKVWVYNYKFNIPELARILMAQDNPSDYEIKYSEKGIFLKLYLVLKFGESLTTITAGMGEYIARALKDTMCVNIDNIILDVTAMATSKTILPRHFEYMYRKTDNV